MAITDRAKEKAGPLPVWGWAVLIGGGIALLIWYKNKHASSSTSSSSGNIDTSTDSSTGVSEDQYAAGEIAADYDLSNQLALNRGTEATLATNVGKQTTAQEANTNATKANTGVVKKNTGRVKQNTGAVKAETKEERKEIRTTRHRPVRRGHPTGPKENHHPVRVRPSG